MMGYEVFSDVNSDDEDEERFAKKLFPRDTRACGAVALPVLSSALLLVIL